MICPQKAFREDLIKFIYLSIDQGYDLIICLDENENIRNRKLASKLNQSGLVKTSYLFSNQKLELSYINRS